MKSITLLCPKDVMGSPLSEVLLFCKLLLIFEFNAIFFFPSSLPFLALVIHFC